MHFHIASLAQMAQEGNVEIAAICDCDQAKLDGATKAYPELAGKKLTVYTDQRKLFDDKSIDAVSFATQDHWHALQTIWACQAGKDVYVEKPATHDIWEGRKMVEAARKYQRMVQIGTQNRSSPNVMEGIRKLKEGVIGKLYMARGMTYKIRGNLGKHRPRPVPQGLELGRLGGAGQDGRVQQLPPSPLVLDLELRQRRHRQPDLARHRHHPLGPRTGHPSEPHDVAGRPLSCRPRTTTPTRPTASRSSASGKAATCRSRSRSATGTPTARRGCATSIRLSTPNRWWG